MLGAGAYAQGTLIFYDNFSDLAFQIYSPDPTAPSVQQVGDTSAQGTISGVSGPYTTYNGVAIGGSLFSGSAPATIPVSSALYADGNLFDAQIYASPAGTTANPNGGGPTPSFSSLSPVSQYITTFATSGGTATGQYLIQPNPSPDNGIPGTGYDGSGLHSANGAHILDNANVAVAAWYNGGGLYTTLAEAQAAGVPWGTSPVVVIGGLGEPASVETSGIGHTSPATTATEPYGLVSFSLTATPEPSTIALGVMGVGAFLARRRKK